MEAQFSVCVTNPPAGAPTYASRCCEWFHMKVPTRSPSWRPSLPSATMSFLARETKSAYV
jgi:hypothetical protein